MRLFLLFIFCFLGGCALFSYAPPQYSSATLGAELPQRINVRIDIYRGEEHSVLLAVMERQDQKLKTVFFSPFGHTVAANTGAIPPARDELRGNQLRPLLDALYQYWSGQAPLDAKRGWQLTKLPDGTTKAELSYSGAILIIRAS